MGYNLFALRGRHDNSTKTIFVLSICLKTIFNVYMLLTDFHTMGSDHFPFDIFTLFSVLMSRFQMKGPSSMVILLTLMQGFTGMALGKGIIVIASVMTMVCPYRPGYWG